jgi:hypothetical protein
MAEKFNTENALLKDGTYDIGAPTVQELFAQEEWDFVVLNDRSQEPAREETKSRTLEALKVNYTSAFPEKAIAVFLQTAAYRLEGIRETEDLGDFDEFTEKLREGYQEYVNLFQGLGIESRLAPVGEAFAVVREENEALFDKLYSWDDFHPSLHGTWLQCCVLYCTMIEEAPPLYDGSWWETARFMEDPPLPLPTDEEAEELRQVAIDVCDF